MPPRKTTFLDATQIDRGLAELREITGGSVALVGGAALQVYGSQRLTVDLDVVGALPIAALPVLGTLTFGGYRSATPSGVPVDVILRDDDFAMLYAAALVHASVVESIPIPVASREFIAAMKMAAGRKKDEADLEFLILDGDLDILATRAIIRQYLGPYAANEFDQLVSLTRWQATQR